MTVYYIGVDGKEYSFELDESKVLSSLTELDTSKFAETGKVFYNNNPDIPINMPAGFGDGLSLGFDIQYINVTNALSYIGNMSKAETKEDYDRWAELYKGTISDAIIYEMNILKREVQRFKEDYGGLTNPVSTKLSEVVGIASQVRGLMSGFASMATLVAGLTAFIVFLSPIIAIVGVIELLDSNIKKALMPSREESLINQSEKVKQLLSAFQNNDLVNTLNRFDDEVITQTKTPVNSANLSTSFSDFFTKYKYYISVAIAVFLGYKFFKSRQNA